MDLNKNGGTQKSLVVVVDAVADVVAFGGCGAVVVEVVAVAAVVAAA